MSIKYDFNGYNVVITGSSRGNGLEIAKSFVYNGARVIGIDCLDSCGDLAKEKNYHHVIFDLKNAQQIHSLVHDIREKYGSINTLINNAGVTCSSPLEKMDLEGWSDIISVNLTAVFALCKSVVKNMDHNKHNTVTTITSLASQLGFPNNSAYAASKGGVLMMMKSFAREFGKDSIRFNCVAPGYIKTEMTRGTYENSITRSQRAAASMLDRWGNSNDLVGAILFLSSTASSFITGEEIKVDGGWTTNGLPHWDSVLYDHTSL